MLWISLRPPLLALESIPGENHAERPDAAPAAVVHEVERRACVHVCNAAAGARGVAPGMKVSAARALLPRLRLHPRSARGEQAALRRLGLWALQFTSSVSPASSELLLEVLGSLKLFGGLDRLCRQVREGVVQQGYQVRLGVAPTPLAAVWLARAGSAAAVLRDDGLAAGLAPIDLGQLGLSPLALSTLRGSGLRTLGDCLALPRDQLALRCGTEFLGRLDRALGRRPDPRPRLRPPDSFRQRLTLPAEEASHGRLLHALEPLLLTLDGFLRARGQGIQRLELRLRHAASAVTTVPLELVAPSRSAAHLLGLLDERLAQLRLPAPVRELEVRVDHPLTLRPEHPDLFGEHDASVQPCLLERLQARLGERAVQGIGAVCEHRPERAWHHCPPGTAAGGAPATARPLWLHDTPVPLAVVDDRPWLDGPLTLRQGPERIESGWWDGADVARDYFVAEAPSGARLWVFRALRGEQGWFLHGLFG